MYGRLQPSRRVHHHPAGPSPISPPAFPRTHIGPLPPLRLPPDHGHRSAPYLPPPSELERPKPMERDLPTVSPAPMSVLADVASGAIKLPPGGHNARRPYAPLSTSTSTTSPTTIIRPVHIKRSPPQTPGTMSSPVNPQSSPPAARPEAAQVTQNGTKDKPVKEKDLTKHPLWGLNLVNDYSEASMRTWQADVEQRTRRSAGLAFKPPPYQYVRQGNSYIPSYETGHHNPLTPPLSSAAATEWTSLGPNRAVTSPTRLVHPPPYNPTSDNHERSHRFDHASSKRPYADDTSSINPDHSPKRPRGQWNQPSSLPAIPYPTPTDLSAPTATPAPKVKIFTKANLDSLGRDDSRLGRQASPSRPGGAPNSETRSVDDDKHDQSIIGHSVSESRESRQYSEQTSDDSDSDDQSGESEISEEKSDVEFIPKGRKRWARQSTASVRTRSSRSTRTPNHEDEGEPNTQDADPEQLVSIDEEGGESKRRGKAKYRNSEREPAPEVEPHSSAPRRTYKRRNMQRRKEQNAQAQKKFRWKKKVMAEQMRNDLEYQTRLAEDLAKSNEQLRAQLEAKDRVTTVHKDESPEASGSGGDSVEVLPIELTATLRELGKTFSMESEQVAGSSEVPSEEVEKALHIVDKLGQMLRAKQKATPAPTPTLTPTTTSTVWTGSTAEVKMEEGEQQNPRIHVTPDHEAVRNGSEEEGVIRVKDRYRARGPPRMWERIERL